jgi:hypothetical protein
MTKSQENKIDKLTQHLDKLTGFLTGVDGTGGFIKRVEKKFPQIFDKLDEMHETLRSKEECEKIRKDDKDLDVKKTGSLRYVLTTLIAFAGFAIAVIVMIRSLF